MRIVVLDGYTENPGDLSWDALRKLGEAEIYDRTAYVEDPLIARRIGEAEIVVTNKTPISRDTLERCPNVKLIAVLATGYNVVDCEAAAERGIPVANVPAYGTASVAQFSIALLLELCLRIGHHSDTVRAGKWAGSVDWCYWDHPLTELDGKTLGIIGFGRIGRAEGRIARALGMEVLALDHHPSEEGRGLAEYVALDELLRRSDVVSLHCNLTPENVGLINRETIAKMKDGALLINTARGPLVNEADVAEALNRGKLAGFAADVVSTEPIRPDNPLLQAKNCILTPHMAWGSRESRQRIMDATVENIRAFLDGRPRNVVNRPVSTLRQDAEKIIRRAIAAVQPDAAVQNALREKHLTGPVWVVAVGKAAWQMAHAAWEELGETIRGGIVITKYQHAVGPIGPLEIMEAGHPVPDENSFAAAARAVELVSALGEKDTVLFLLSGGGSALFESPLIDGAELADITGQLLSGGADIVEMNTVRKRLSAVKGGRFARLCAPARVFSVVLSDIVGDPLDMIASGPACPDSSTCAMAREVAKKYRLRLSDKALACLDTETPKTLDNVETVITGSVSQLCASARETAAELGYEPVVLTDRLTCEAKEAGISLAAMARVRSGQGKRIALIAGGETVVHVTGTGLGGRNQELALSAAVGIEGLPDVAVFSVGSDGTDGPTDAAGGYVDGDTAARLRALGQTAEDYLADNDAYHALSRCGGLIVTGPTGTNVNDLTVALIRG